MFRTDVPTAAASLPAPSAPGVQGYFTNGSPTVPATVVDADWLNGIQEELMSIVTAASLTPSKTTRNQVLTALQEMFGQLGAANSWAGAQTFEDGLTVQGAGASFAASTTTYASLNVPQGVAPTSPDNGDIWTTSSGVFARISGATQQLANIKSANTWLLSQNFSGGLTGSLTGNVTQPVVVIATAATLTVAQVSGTLVEQNAGSNVTTTLPSAASCGGARFTFRASSAAQTLASSGGGFYGPAGNSGASTLIIGSGFCVMLESDGSNWVAYGSAVPGGGRLLNVQVFPASGAYNATPGTQKIIVEAAGGGGAGGGLSAIGGGTFGVSPGGGAGAYLKALFTSGFTGGIAVTVGAGGVGVAGGAGGNGGATSFGPLLSVSGGVGGTLGAVGAQPLFAGPPADFPSISTTGTQLVYASGSQGSWGINATSSSLGGSGGSSVFGGGAPGPGLSQPGITASTPGSGGSGICTNVPQSAAAGGNGAPGLLIVWEFA